MILSDREIRAALTADFDFKAMLQRLGSLVGKMAI